MKTVEHLLGFFHVRAVGYELTNVSLKAKDVRGFGGAKCAQVFTPSALSGEA